jgi:hypothetical protein
MMSEPDARARPRPSNFNEILIPLRQEGFMQYDWTGETIRRRSKVRLIATVVAAAGISVIAIWMARLV